MAACLPYLLLSVFVDFIHLHPLLSDAIAPTPISHHVGTPSPHGAKLPVSTCVICQWTRAGKGLQPTVAVGASAATLQENIEPVTEPGSTRPTLLVPDFRGPPLSLFA